MKINSIIAVILALIIYSKPLLAQSNFLSAKEIKAKIAIEFKNVKDKSEINIEQQYDRYALSSTNLDEDFKYSREESGLNTSIIFVSLEQPKIIFINLKPLYIEPNNVVELQYDYSNLNDNGAYVETFIKKSADGIFLVEDINNYQAKIIAERNVILKKLINNKFDINYSIGLIDSISNRDLSLIIKNNPSNTFDIKKQKLFKDYFFEKYYNNILIALRTSAENLIYSEQTLLALNKQISMIDTFKDNQYFFAQKNIYKDFYQKKWSKNNFEFNFIINDLNGYDNLTREYFLLMILKNDIDNIRTRGTIERIKDAITSEDLRSKADKYVPSETQTIKEIGHLTNEIKTSSIYNTQLTELKFGDIFKNTKQTYLYLDFCGSWCVPCIKEIENYTTSARQFDNSTKLKPIWLFFEKDKTSWLKVIEKYKLKKENCFLILDSKLVEIFGKQFDWIGEFPRHFIFSNEGKLIDSNAEALSKLNESTLPKLIQPIPPPGKK